MADISYTPNFHHAAWVDNVDRVEAGGTNGFNTRFETIESDLHGVSTVIAQIDAELDEIGERPPTVTISVAPTLQPVASAPAWALQTSGNAVAPTTGGPNGVLPLALPDQVRLTSLRVRGRGVAPNGLNTAFFLIRVSVTDGSTQNVAAFDTSTVPLGTVFPIPNSALSLVDLAGFRYVISANSGVATNDPVTLVSFQLTYNNP